MKTKNTINNLYVLIGRLTALFIFSIVYWVLVFTLTN